MELAGAGPPLGPISQPGLVGLTSPWRDVAVDGEPLSSSTLITAPPTQCLGHGCPADGFLGWALPKHKGKCAECWKPSR